MSASSWVMSDEDFSNEATILGLEVVPAIVPEGKQAESVVGPESSQKWPNIFRCFKEFIGTNNLGTVNSRKASTGAIYTGLNRIGDGRPKALDFMVDKYFSDPASRPLPFTDCPASIQIFMAHKYEQAASTSAGDNLVRVNIWVNNSPLLRRGNVWLGNVAAMTEQLAIIGMRVDENVRTKEGLSLASLGTGHVVEPSFQIPRDVPVDELDSATRSEAAKQVTAYKLEDHYPDPVHHWQCLRQTARVMEQGVQCQITTLVGLKGACVITPALSLTTVGAMAAINRYLMLHHVVPFIRMAAALRDGDDLNRARFENGPLPANVNIVTADDLFQTAFSTYLNPNEHKSGPALAEGICFTAGELLLEPSYISYEITAAEQEGRIDIRPRIVWAARARSGTWVNKAFVSSYTTFDVKENPMPILIDTVLVKVALAPRVKTLSALATGLTDAALKSWVATPKAPANLTPLTNFIATNNLSSRVTVKII